jgi:hypothetical protein
MRTPRSSCPTNAIASSGIRARPSVIVVRRLASTGISKGSA